MKDLDQIADRLKDFAEARQWKQFHSPKNLSMALSVEVAELIEHFQWMTEADSRNISDDVRLKVSEEIADVQIYLIQLADALGVDILDSVWRKVAANELKYPIEQVIGSSRKYSDYKSDGSDH